MCNYQFGSCPNFYRCGSCMFSYGPTWSWTPIPVNIIVGHCPVCGAPIYEDKNENLKVVYTCNCRKEDHHG